MTNCNSPDSTWCSAFTCWQIKHLATNLEISCFIPGHQYICFRSQNIFILPRWIKYILLCASVKMSCFNSKLFRTHNLLWNYNILSIPTLNSVDESLWIWSRLATNFGSTFWNSSILWRNTGLAFNSAKIEQSWFRINWAFNALKANNDFWLNESTTTLAFFRLIINY